MQMNARSRGQIFGVLATALIALMTAACGSSSSSTGTTGSTSGTSGTSTSSSPTGTGTTGTGTTSGSSTVAFNSSSESVAQGVSAVSMVVKRTGTMGTAASVIYTTVNGTAVAGTDFTAMSGTLSWTENDSTSRTISVPLRTSSPFRGDRSFAVELQDPSTSAAVGSPGTSTVSIVGADSGAIGALQLSAATFGVAQSTGDLTVTVTRTGGSAGAVTVAYATSDATAVAGTNYTSTHGTLEWADGDAASKTFVVPVSTAPAFAGTKTFNLTLSDPGNGASLGTDVSAVATITGSAVPSSGTSTGSPGSVSLSASNYSVTQSVGTATMSVNRTGGSSGVVTVNYASANGTAVAGTDFTAASGTVSWADGDTSTKTISVAVSNASPYMGNKTFTVALSNPSAGATVASPGSAVVTIAGDGSQPVGTLVLSAASYSVAQGAGTMTVTVNRVSGSNGTVNVSYATASGSATAGADFTAATGTLTWANGDTAAKTFSVPISGATPFSGSRSFTVALASPSGGAALGSPSTATVTISGSASAAIGSVQLSAATYPVAQSAGSLTVTVNRTGGTSGAVTVNYATADGTALGGTDYTSASGTLDWTNGDASSKTFTVPVSTATAFSGLKTFTVTISGPTGGATLSTPSSATVTITGSGASSGSGGGTGGGTGTGSPSAPAGGIVVTGETQNSISISWTASVAGAAAIDHYQIYRNGAAYATTTSTSYTDSAATNATVPTYTGPATTYTYAVAAVDTDGNSSAQTTQATYWVYYNGVYNWAGDYDFSGASSNYSSTAGSPETGSYDIATTNNGPYGGFLPYAGKTVPEWDLEGSIFNYITIDMKPTVANQTWSIMLLDRVVIGDISNNQVLSMNSYGTPVQNQWTTYKIPLAALGIGKNTLTASISGSTMTVTAVSSNVMLSDGGFISGPGIAAGTYITGNSSGNGGVGTYTLSSSQSVGSTTVQYQRTNIYKVNIQDKTGSSSNVYYIDNFGFTAQ